MVKIFGARRDAPDDPEYLPWRLSAAAPNKPGSSLNESWTFWHAARDDESVVADFPRARGNPAIEGFFVHHGQAFESRQATVGHITD